MALSLSTVAFPSSDPPLTGSPPTPQPSRPPLLPFRRISLPTAPALLKRHSTFSIESFGSMPEEGGSGTTAIPSVMKTPNRKSQTRPISLENHRRLSRRNQAHQFDHARETKRRKVVEEFYETERAYVDGLDLIYQHFLTPLIASLDTPSPLLERAELTSVFSNFIDIWNLHHSFFTLLTTLLSSSLYPSENTPPPQVALPPLSPVLISHFPYLSLYNPFITSFPSALSSISSLSKSNPAFGNFIRQREEDKRCGKLKLRDWLLTIVQRCPRYLLLLKDLIGCTDPEDPEHASLMAVYTMLSRITSSLNTSLHTHAQTLSLLALQRSTLNLPFQLIVPGRTLLKRGTLIQLEQSSAPRPREFLLFTDCLLWLATENIVDNEWVRRSEHLFRGPGISAGRRPDFKRNRSKSENELPRLKDPSEQTKTKKVHFINQSGSPGNSEEKWLFKGKAELVDLEVVVSSSQERRLELLSPEMSFAVYAESEEERDDWASALRAAKSSLFVSLNLMHPNSTLTSSSSTNHLRKTLQALPYLPEANESLPKRSKVEHFVPAIWVPDEKTSDCMRCGRVFGWRRRRHHCRLCGRCVCANCSSRTFFVHDPSVKGGNKSARACNACYEAVFPLLEDPNVEGETTHSTSGSTFSNFPSWKTAQPISTEFMPSALMHLHTGDGGLGDSTNVAPGVRRRRYSRPLSHPAIPQEFHESRTDLLAPFPEHTGRDDNPGSIFPIQPVHRIDSPPRTPDQYTVDVPNPYARNSMCTLQTPASPDSPASLPPSPAMSEETARRQLQRKRFSLPALAIQTPAVVALPNATGVGRSKRFSLVLGGRSRAARAQVHVQEGGGRDERIRQELDLKDGAAAAKLSELLVRARE